MDCALVLGALALASVGLTAAGADGRTRERFDDGWRFLRGEATEAFHPDFDDSQWREVDLPHDFSIEDLPAPDNAPPPQISGPFDSEAEGGGSVGYTVGGVGWYRKAFATPERLGGRRVSITFDGVYMDSQVWLNGESLGTHPYGYTSFRLDLTPHLRYGDDPNVIAVRVDSSGKTSRWYCGSGIYRHVWLTVTDPVHLDEWGQAVTTRQVSRDSATVHVETTVTNPEASEARTVISWSIATPDGDTVAAASDRARVRPGDSRVISADLQVPAPELWSPDTPSLYRLVTTLTVDGADADSLETPIGIRTITCDAATGLKLNGEPLLLRGGCVHHDSGPLGARTYDRAEERRVELLKASGFNAIRTAHNPPSSGFLDACDRLGVLVIDEAFDCWRRGKNPQDYGRFFDDWWQRDIDSMVLRDRNHPSVFAWSIGNEVIEQGTPEGAEIGAMLAAYVRKLDPSRPVAIGAHPGVDPWERNDDLFAALDLCGSNYKWDRYVPDHERVPSRVIMGTESFPQQCFDSWQATAADPWVIGDFVWTAFDYLGEVAIGHTHYAGKPTEFGAWPWTAANCGDIDICGLKRPQSYYRDAVWGIGAKVSCFVQTPLPPGETAELVAGWGWPNVQASWTWPGHEGSPLTVQVYSSCEQARLLLNGRDLGAKDTSATARHAASWEVPYEPGELTAVGLDAQGREVERWVLCTARPATRLRLTPDRRWLAADGQDLSFVYVEEVDSVGFLRPDADDVVRFAVTGPAEIVAVANSNPRSTESFQQPQRKAWRGRALVIVKAGRESGKVHLTAQADGLRSAEVTLTIR